MRIVVDTNLIASALLWGGTPEALLSLARQLRVTLYTSPALLAELEEILERPKFAEALRRVDSTPAQLTGDYRALAQVVLPPHVPRVVDRDPDDDQVLACALTADAALIVSGDRDLLDLGYYHRIPIITARDALMQIDLARP